MPRNQLIFFLIFLLIKKTARACARGLWITGISPALGRSMEVLQRRCRQAEGTGLEPQIQVGQGKCPTAQLSANREAHKRLGEEERGRWGRGQFQKARQTAPAGPWRGFEALWLVGSLGPVERLREAPGGLWRNRSDRAGSLPQPEQPRARCSPAANRCCHAPHGARIKTAGRSCCVDRHP